MKTRYIVITLTAICTSCIGHADEIAADAFAEMSAQRTKTFDVATSKLKGSTSFRISYPKSWSTTDSARPRVVTRIASANGEGMDSLVIVVGQSNLKSKNPTPDSVFTKEFFSKFELPGSTVVRSERVKEGTFDGAVIEYFVDQSRPPMRMRVFVTNYVFTQRGALVQLQFYVLLGEKEDKKSDDARIIAFKPLWKAMLATLKLE